MNNTLVASRKQIAALFIAHPVAYETDMDSEESARVTWIVAMRTKAPYAIGLCGLIAWFALLYFMLRDVA